MESAASTSNSADKKWVKFEENDSGNYQNESETIPTTQALNYNGAVIDTETVQVDIEKIKQLAKKSNTESQGNSPVPSQVMRNVNLDDVDTSRSGRVPIETTIQRGFANGDIIVTVLPVNQKWPWITPAEFRPELVPEELMAEGLSLTVEDYVQIMETLVHDVRFTVYNVCYKRLLMAWLMASFIVLLSLLFSGVKGITLFGCGVIWLIINAGAIFVCMFFKSKMNHGLERAVSKANQTLVRHKIILGVDDRGKLSCHKTHLCFIYFDTSDCVRKLQSLLEAEEAASGGDANAEEQRRQREIRQRMDIEDSDIIVTGTNPTRISRKQGRAVALLLRYSQRWAKALARQSLGFQFLAAQAAFNATGVVGAGQSSDGPTAPSPYSPRHCASSMCPCQFIENHLHNKLNPKPRSKFWKLPSFGFQ